MALKKYLHFCAICLFCTFGCDLFEEPEDNEVIHELVNTLGQDNSYFDHIGQYDEYFFDLNKKLEITYEATELQVVSGSANIINQQVEFITIPEYLLYLTPEDSAYSDSSYNADLFQFAEYDSSAVITSDLRNKIVKPHSGIESIDSIVWVEVDGKYKIYKNDLDKDDLDDNPIISENEDIEFISEIVDGDAIAYLDIEGSNFLIWTDDQVLGIKEIRIIDSIQTNLVFIDLAELDTQVTMFQAVDNTTGEDKFFEHTSIFRFTRAVHVDSILYQLTSSEDLESVLFDMNGDTIKSFVPDSSYILSDSTEINPIQNTIYLDTVYKSFIDYESFDTLITNDIIDTYVSNENVYSVAKTITHSPTEIYTDYFIYRDGISSQGYHAVLELIYPGYFNYYGGIYEPPSGADDEYYVDNGWSFSSTNRDSIFFYLPFREGEIVENEWTVTFDDPENGNSAVYDIFSNYTVETTDFQIPIFPIDGADIVPEFSEDSLDYIFNDAMLITKSTQMTMIGTGVTYYEDHEFVLVKNLGIIGQVVTYRWGDYPEVLGYEWLISSYSETDVDNSSGGAVFTSLDEFAQAVGSQNFKVKRSAGLKKLEPAY